MAMPGKKPSLGILIGIGKPKSGGKHRMGDGSMMSDEDPSMGDEMIEEEGPDVVAARAFMDAVKGDDPQAVVDTLKTLSDAIEDGQEMPEEDMDMASHENGPPDHIMKHGGSAMHRKHHEEDAY